MIFHIFIQSKLYAKKKCRAFLPEPFMEHSRLSQILINSKIIIEIQIPGKIFRLRKEEVERQNRLWRIPYSTLVSFLLQRLCF